MTEVTENNNIENESINPSVRLWVSESEGLVLGPSAEDKRYPFMPTIREMLVGYCIMSDLEVSDKLLAQLPDKVRDFIESGWNHGKLEIRRKMNQEKGRLLSLGNPIELGIFSRKVLESREIDDVERDGAIGIFQKPIYAVADDIDLQKSLERRLPFDLKGIMGTQGFNTYLVSY